MKRSMTALLAAVALVAVAGCGGTPVVSHTDADQPTQTESTSDQAAADEQADAESTAPRGTYSFGETVTYKDGLSVTVSEPAPFEPSETAAGHNAGESAVIFTVTVSNGSKEPYSPSMFFSSLRSGMKEASAIFDSAQGLEGTPSTDLQPGDAVQFSIAYSVLDPADLTLQVEADMGFDYDAATFKTR